MLLHKHKIRSKKKLQPIEKLMYIVSFAYPLTAVPQVYKVYTTHNVESFAMVSWMLYLVFGSVYLAYAFYKKLRPLMIEGGLWLSLYALMFTGIIIFR